MFESFPPATRKLCEKALEGGSQAAVNLAAAAAEHLASVCGHDAVLGVLLHLGEDLVAVAELVDAALSAGGKVPDVRLGICDRRYVLLSGQSGFFDVESGEPADILPEPALETITISLPTLAARMIQHAQDVESSIQ